MDDNTECVHDAEQSGAYYKKLDNFVDAARDLAEFMMADKIPGSYHFPAMNFYDTFLPEAGVSPEMHEASVRIHRAASAVAMVGGCDDGSDIVPQDLGQLIHYIADLIANE